MFIVMRKDCGKRTMKGSSRPVIHATLEEAKNEAGRLAVKEQSTFYVLQVLGMAAPPKEQGYAWSGVK